MSMPNYEHASALGCDAM